MNKADEINDIKEAVKEVYSFAGYKESVVDDMFKDLEAEIDKPSEADEKSGWWCLVCEGQNKRDSDKNICWQCGDDIT